MKVTFSNECAKQFTVSNIFPIFASDFNLIYNDKENDI